MHIYQSYFPVIFVSVFYDTAMFVSSEIHEYQLKIQIFGNSFFILLSEKLRLWFEDGVSDKFYWMIYFFLDDIHLSFILEKSTINWFYVKVKYSWFDITQGVINST